MSSDRPQAATAKRSFVLWRSIREAMFTGFALTIPLLVTLFVVAFAIDFVASTVQPIAEFLRESADLGSDASVAVLQVLTVLTFLASVFVIGLVAEFRSGDRIDELFDTTMERIPGIGPVYTSFNEMSTMLLRNDTHSFQEVYLVEYPTTGSYSLAFLTAETPSFVGEATGHDDMLTLFMPMAPNPVMGGFVVHVAAENAYDVDMTVEEALQSIVTSGVAVGEESDHSLRPEELAAIGHPGPGGGPAEEVGNRS